MNKKILAVLLVLLAIVLVACKPEPDPIDPDPIDPDPTDLLTSITISGVADAEVEFDAEFNALTGVTATGNDGVDYTDQITLASLASNINITTGVVNTTVPGSIDVRYEARIVITDEAEPRTVLAQVWRKITVLAPPPVEGQLLQNGDFALGIVGWNDPAVVYIADGAQMTLEVVDGILNADVTVGTNPYTPRFGQMGIPFEQGKSYKVSFSAKSSAPKTIHSQVGELLAAAPYFINFRGTLPGLYFNLTTEFAEYEYSFNMTLDNPRGGILFELGTVLGDATNGLVEFEWIKVEETQPVDEVYELALNGVREEVTLLLGAEPFNPLAGVTATDTSNEDITDTIEVVITDEDGEELEIDIITTDEVGVYFVTYTIGDGEETLSVTTKVSVVSMQFKAENLLVNGNFTDENEGEWVLWAQDWGTAPIIEHGINEDENVYEIDITGGGDADWAIQFSQLFDVEFGVTYRVVFEAKASAARTMHLKLGVQDGEVWTGYYEELDIQLSTEYQVYEYVFTVVEPSAEVQIQFALGATAAFADGVVSFKSIAVNERDADPIIPNANFDVVGWRYFNATDENAAGQIVDGEFKYVVDTHVKTTDNWTLQLIQDLTAMGLDGDAGVIELLPGTTYTLSFDAYASIETSITALIISSDDWANLVIEEDAVVAITTEKTTYTVTIVTPAEFHGNEVLKFEFGLAFDSAEDGTDFIVFDNILIYKADDEDETPVDSVYNGTFDQVLGFVFENSGETEHGSFKLVEDGLEVTVATSGGVTEPWVPHVFTMIDDLAPGTYTMVLSLTSSVSRTLRVNLVLPDAGYVSLLPDPGRIDFTVVADELTTVTVQFTVTEDLSNVKFELDFGADDDMEFVPGVFVLHQVLIYQDFN